MRPNRFSIGPCDDPRHFVTACGIRSGPKVDLGGAIIKAAITLPPPMTGGLSSRSTRGRRSAFSKAAVQRRSAAAARKPRATLERSITESSTFRRTSSAASSGEEIKMPIVPTELDDYVLAFDVADVAQAGAQCFHAAREIGGRGIKTAR